MPNASTRRTTATPPAATRPPGRPAAPHLLEPLIACCACPDGIASLITLDCDRCGPYPGPGPALDDLARDGGAPSDWRASDA